MSDARLDRELRAALNVEPSPEFAARIRMRVASEATASRRPAWLAWVTVGGGTVVAVVVVVALMRPAADIASQGTTAAVRRPTPNVAAPAASAAPTGGVSTQLQSAGLPRPSQPTAGESRNIEEEAILDKPPFAGVLISADEVRAYEKLIAAVQERRLPPLPETVEDQPNPLSIEIAPLVIEPLPVMARLE